MYPLQTERNGPNGSVKAAASIPALGFRFDMTLRQIRLLDALAAERRGSESESAGGLDRNLELFRDALFGELDDILLTAVASPAKSRSQLEIKARIYLEYCVPEDGDIAHELGKSICRDLAAGGVIESVNSDQSEIGRTNGQSRTTRTLAKSAK